jgi:thiamine kinase-like enzyme
LRNLLQPMTLAPAMALEEHPYAVAARGKRDAVVDALLKKLREAKWTVVVHHGDMAPWNLIRNELGSLAAVDWELGSLEGFPYLDLAHHLLQTAALVYRWPAARAVQYAENYLAKDLGRFARPMIDLCAYTSYRAYEENGLSSDHPLQIWKAKIWKEGM